VIALVAMSVVLPLGLLATILVVNRDSGDDDVAVADACDGATASSVPVPPSTTPVTGRAAVGEPAPDFVLLTLDECAQERLSAHRGMPVVLTFFASWCHPCEQEMPLLESAHADQPDEFDVLAVTYEDFRRDAERFTERLGVTYPALYDTDGTVADRYGVTGIPQTWFIDEAGIVRDRVFGITSKAALDEPLEALLRA
jgi:cytochrome c biogenesis protein CcmG/thiol:disulfide interchange protein DsbE